MGQTGLYHVLIDRFHIKQNKENLGWLFTMDIINTGLQLSEVCVINTYLYLLTQCHHSPLSGHTPENMEDMGVGFAIGFPSKYDCI